MQRSNKDDSTVAVTVGCEKNPDAFALEKDRIPGPKWERNGQKLLTQRL